MRSFFNEVFLKTELIEKSLICSKKIILIIKTTFYVIMKII